MQKRPASPAGTPPYTHTGFLRDDILYSYDAVNQSVVIGPWRKPWLNRLHEYGGVAPMIVVRGARGTTWLQRAKSRVRCSSRVVKSLGCPFTVTGSANIGGKTIQTVISRNTTAQFGIEPALPAADAGALSTRANDTDGQLTMASAEHGIETGDKIAIFFAGGVCYGATVGTVAGTSVPFTGATGVDVDGVPAVLPAQGAAIVADVEVEQTFAFDGDYLEGIICKHTRRGHHRFLDGGSAVLAAADVPAAEPWGWISGQGGSNPLTGNAVAKIVIANGDSANASTVTIGAGINTEA